MIGLRNIKANQPCNMKKIKNSIYIMLLLTIITSCETAEDRYQLKGEQYLNKLKSLKNSIENGSTVDLKTIKEEIHEYNTIQDSIQTIYYNLKADLLINILNEKDYVKSKLVLKIISGQYKGNGGIYSYSPSWGKNFQTGGISTELIIDNQHNSKFARKAMDGGRSIPIEIFEITIKNIKHLDENLISGEIFHKRDNYWVCNFQFKNKILHLTSEYNNGNWESMNKAVTKESLEYLR